MPGGEKLEIFLQWTEGKKIKKVKAEEVIFDRVNKKKMEYGDWIFTGSMIYRGGILAQEDKSLIATYHDPGAIINYACPTQSDATGYSAYDANPEVLPPRSTRITITIRKEK